jgi:hypothetical protein
MADINKDPLLSSDPYQSKQKTIDVEGKTVGYEKAVVNIPKGVEVYDVGVDKTARQAGEDVGQVEPKESVMKRLWTSLSTGGERMTAVEPVGVTTPKQIGMKTPTSIQVQKPIAQEAPTTGPAAAKIDAALGNRSTVAPLVYEPELLNTSPPGLLSATPEGRQQLLQEARAAAQRQSTSADVQEPVQLGPYQLDYGRDAGEAFASATASIKTMPGIQASMLDPKFARIMLNIYKQKIKKKSEQEYMIASDYASNTDRYTKLYMQDFVEKNPTVRTMLNEETISPLAQPQSGPQEQSRPGTEETKRPAEDAIKDALGRNPEKERERVWKEAEREKERTWKETQDREKREATLKGITMRESGRQAREENKAEAEKNKLALRMQARWAQMGMTGMPFGKNVMTEEFRRKFLGEEPKSPVRREPTSVVNELAMSRYRSEPGATMLRLTPSYGESSTLLPLPLPEEEAKQAYNERRRDVLLGAMGKGQRAPLPERPSLVGSFGSPRKEFVTQMRQPVAFGQAQPWQSIMTGSVGGRTVDKILNRGGGMPQRFGQPSFGQSQPRQSIMTGNVGGRTVDKILNRGGGMPQRFGQPSFGQSQPRQSIMTGNVGGRTVDKILNRNGMPGRVGQPLFQPQQRVPFQSFASTGLPPSLRAQSIIGVRPMGMMGGMQGRGIVGADRMSVALGTRRQVMTPFGPAPIATSNTDRLRSMMGRSAPSGLVGGMVPERLSSNDERLRGMMDSRNGRGVMPHAHDRIGINKGNLSGDMKLGVMMGSMRALSKDREAAPLRRQGVASENLIGGSIVTRILRLPNLPVPRAYAPLKKK